MAVEPSTAQPPADAGNAHFAWDEFAPQEYSEHNYGELRADDARILGVTRDWFSEALSDQHSARSGLDAGAGPNLYPALAMLPYCDELTLREYSAANVAWLERQVLALPGSWAPFWERARPTADSTDFESARRKLSNAAKVEQGSVFELPERRWNLGTMFFVAESISPRFDEFAEANRRFLGALTPGAPFAAAYMENSDGYEVAGTRFPATAVDADDVRACLEQGATHVRVHRIAMDPAPLREGYTGMIVATGLVNEAA